MSLTKIYKSIPDFNNMPVYDENDLGLSFKDGMLIFKIWSPLAEEVIIRFYETPEDKKDIKQANMQRGVNGSWIYTTEDIYKDKFYTFQIRIGRNWQDETTDPYVKAVSANGNMGAIVNLEETNPPDWGNDNYENVENYNDAVIYELHIRDFTIHSSSAVSEKGKYKGLSLRNTYNEHGFSTALEHLIEMGITHVHLMPVYDFMSVDEKDSEKEQYNWGYDPLHYNVPEGWYSCAPTVPKSRIYEFKEMVQALHKNGIGVIMDMVYNHTGQTEDSVFNKIFPGYYYRLNWNATYSNASGCGNETASERAMVRKFIIDSIKYWIEEYHIDGFRFDLMGIHDIETMNIIKEEIKKINPRILVYGEGWTAAESPLPFEKRALKENINKLNEIAVFNDNIRDAIKGSCWNAGEIGFINGQGWLGENIKQGLAGSVFHQQINYNYINRSEAWAQSPLQSVNYASCHDNYTLYDKIKICLPAGTSYDVMQMQKLAYVIVLMSQGIPFIHAGGEFMRSKKGVENSYNSPDAINSIDWNLKTKNIDLFRYIKGLIEIRKKHKAFRLKTKEEINKHLSFIETPCGNVVAYEISEYANNDSWKRIIIILNSDNKCHKLAVPNNKWVVVADYKSVNIRGLRTIDGGTINITPISALILVGD